MKKFLALSFVLLLASSFAVSQPAQASSSSYWDYYRNYYSGENARMGGSRYRVPSYRSRSAAPRSTTSSSRYGRTSNYRTYSTKRTSTQSAKTLKTIVTPIALRQDINSITSQRVDLFNIGLSYPRGTSNTFSSAASVNNMQFQIVDNSGVVSDFSDFDLVIENQNFEFERNGYITLQFNNLRLARGESRALDVQIKLNDPGTFARQSGSFRVKLTSMNVTEENSVVALNNNISGKTVSDYVVLNPSPSVSGGGTTGTASATPVFISGRALGAGEKAVVLSAKLKAYRDDFLVESVTVRNTFGSNVDALIQEVRLINNSTGKVLSSRRFTNGVAAFNLSSQNQVYIARNTQANLVFEVLVRDNLPSNITDSRLELTFNPSDIEIFGIGSGKAVPDSSKNFNVDAETFTVNQGGGGSVGAGGISFSASQPSFTTHGTLEQIVRFQIRNAGSGSMSVGRISMQAFPSGVEFSGGISTDDAALVRVVNGFQEYGSGFATTGASGNVFTFDTGTELYLSPGEVQEFALKLKLDNTGSSDDSDSVSVKILGDSSFTKGTLAGVRGGGASFVWSDHSGRPHTLTTTDWLSGYLVSGLPTSNYVRYRR